MEECYDEVEDGTTELVNQPGDPETLLVVAKP